MSSNRRLSRQPPSAATCSVAHPKLRRTLLAPSHSADARWTEYSSLTIGARVSVPAEPTELKPTCQQKMHPRSLKSLAPHDTDGLAPGGE
jgi:hypothetical protein